MRRLLFAALLLRAATLAAQAPTDTTLAAAIRLVTEGQGDSARALVRNRMRGLQRSDSLYPEALFVAGVVANNVDSATGYFRQVAIEFSSSSWADQALVRIAQLAFAQGDYATAARSVNRVLLDYPHQQLRTSDARFRRLKKRYSEYRQANGGRKPVYYAGRDKWTELPQEFF